MFGLAKAKIQFAKKTNKKCVKRRQIKSNILCQPIETTSGQWNTDHLRTNAFRAEKLTDLFCLIFGFTQSYIHLQCKVLLPLFFLFRLVVRCFVRHFLIMLGEIDFLDFFSSRLPYFYELLRLDFKFKTKSNWNQIKSTLKHEILWDENKQTADYFFLLQNWVSFALFYFKSVSWHFSNVVFVVCTLSA